MNTINAHNLSAARKARILIRRTLTMQRAVQRAQRQALAAVQAHREAQRKGVTQRELQALANKMSLTSNRVAELLRVVRR